MTGQKIYKWCGMEYFDLDDLVMDARSEGLKQIEVEVSVIVEEIVVTIAEDDTWSSR